jgi:3'-phosphoadenosine 5'-phosphosulfate (PAPS) 3'-phosphatase
MKSDHNPVTEADLKIQTMMLRALRAFWPTLKIIGEEAKDYEGEITLST